MGWHIYWIWIAIISLVTFLVYGYDKARARKGQWRVPEKALHILALAGGFPGGWAGRAIFHHKTQKGFFTFVLAVSTLIHLAIWYWLIFRA
jgi:uncharacterized membrane protein YsdA (DUF1294 family)